MQSKQYFRSVACIVLATHMLCASAVAEKSAELRPTVWTLDSVSRIGGHAATVLGSPREVGEGTERAICFNGTSDGIFLPINPIADWNRFTIEALIKADVSGPEEQRFLHIQDERESRLLLEIRLPHDGEWALDTFLFVSPDVRLTLLDRTKLHSADQWHWVALTFDGETMAHFVDGRKELEGKIAFRPMTKGRMSLGVRLNKVSWYKGCIRELRFTPQVLTVKDLTRALPR